MPTLSAAERRKRLAEFVSDPEVRRDLGKTKMTLFRWDRDPEKAPPGWPAKVKVGTRSFRYRPAYEAFRKGLVETALAEREQALQRVGGAHRAAARAPASAA